MLQQLQDDCPILAADCPGSRMKALAHCSGKADPRAEKAITRCPLTSLHLLHTNKPAFVIKWAYFPQTHFSSQPTFNSEYKLTLCLLVCGHFGGLETLLGREGKHHC